MLSDSERMAKRNKKPRATVRKASTTVPSTPAISQPRPLLFERDWLWGLGLVLVVFLAYLPMWHAAFIWDDDVIVTANPCVVGPLGLKEIWTTNAARFYPLVLSTFWLEHALWGLAPLPYHLVNISLHALSAVVLWRVLRNLDVPGSLGAALWALHPIQVETVAWVSETKNTESCLFYLLTILFFLKGLRAETSPASGVRWNLALSLLFAALAMASKSSTLLLPVVLGLCIWWVKGRWRWRDMAKVAPFLLMVIIAIAITAKTAQKYGGNEMYWARNWLARMAMAGDIFWIYLGNLAWPHPLMTFYPIWEADTAQWISYLPTAILLLVPAVLWFNHRSWSRPCLFAFAYFLVNLFPVMGLFSMMGFRYSGRGSLAVSGQHGTAGAGRRGIDHAGKYLDFEALLAAARSRCRIDASAGDVELVLHIGIPESNGALLDNLTHNPTCWLAYNGLWLGIGQSRAIGRGHHALPEGAAVQPHLCQPLL